MKIGRFLVNILAINSLRSAKKRRKTYPPYGKYDEQIDIPFIDDGEFHHKFDIMRAKENKKNVLIFDIHGGSYIYGEHIDQYVFGDYFLREGYDFVSADYLPIDGKKMSIKNIFDDLYQLIKYLFEHQKELQIENDEWVITGDSAGGHLALSICEMLLDEKYAKEAGYDFPKIKPVACLANCPVYDFVNLSDGYLTKSGKKRLFGPRYDDEELKKLFCPRVHIDSLTCPVFVSTSKRDFLRMHSLMLEDDLRQKGKDCELIDLNTDDKTTGHVHNVLHPFRPYSDQVNRAMIDFIEKARKK